MKELSVVILNYNVRHFLELCLKSVQGAIENIDAEIIVVNNNSTDNSCKMVKQLFPGVKLIENKTNFGFSKGNNIGVAQANGKYICILNPDTVVAENTFSKLLHFAKQKENLGIVGCQLIDGRGKFLPESKRNIPTARVSLKKLLGNPKDYYANHVSETEIGKVNVLVGAFMLMTKNVYDLVGGFDEDYFMYGEDIDLSYKVLKAGYNNYYFGDTTIIHFKGESTLKDANYAKRFYGAMQIFYEKHFKKNQLFNLLVSTGVKLAYAFRSEPKVETINPKQTVVMSKSLPENLENQLPKPVEVISTLNHNLKSETLVVFDCNYLKTEAVISFMKKKSIQKNILFRLLPKNSNFIIGSDSAVSRGSVIHFN